MAGVDPDSTWGRIGTVMDYVRCAALVGFGVVCAATANILLGALLVVIGLGLLAFRLGTNRLDRRS